MNCAKPMLRARVGRISNPRSSATSRTTSANAAAFTW
jgi:hypothetical protein